MSKLESSQKDENTAQSADSLKLYRKPRAFNCWVWKYNNSWFTKLRHMLFVSNSAVIKLLGWIYVEAFCSTCSITKTSTSWKNDELWPSLF